MKSIFLSVAMLVALSSSVFAQAAKIPTGIDVPGCTWYRLVSGAVVQVCNPDTNVKEILESMVNPASPKPNGGSAGSSPSE